MAFNGFDYSLLASVGRDGGGAKLGLSGASTLFYSFVSLGHDTDIRVDTVVLGSRGNPFKSDIFPSTLLFLT